MVCDMCVSLATGPLADADADDVADGLRTALLWVETFGSRGQPLHLPFGQLWRLPLLGHICELPAD